MREQTRSNIRQNMKRLCISCIIIGLAFVLFFSDSIAVQMQGVAYFMDNTDTKFDHVITPDLNSYSVQIDLDNLGSNAGKVLYSNNGVQVKVESVYKAETRDNAGDNKQYYIVEFHSFPKYSASHCEFISFFPSSYGNKGFLFPRDLQAKCKTSYNGKEYNRDPILIVVGAEKLIGCALFPSQAINDEVLNNPHGTATFTVSNLYLHTWDKK